MAELEKFKRRLIRSVARLLLQENLPEEDVWNQLKKETRCDCKLLWYRMRALTMKKLDRLLVADDKLDNIAAAARLSYTDWLLFDLVLVHEKIDVIGRSRVLETKVDYRVMIELFSLVQRYYIEDPVENSLADRWYAATVAYNTHGRHCSPMLLQRRWYQLKELTRSNFYQLWQNYRGNQRLWETAQKHSPSRLQMAIAKRFPHVITKPFMSWEEMVEKGLVVLPQEFEEKTRKKDVPKPFSANDPDLVLVEPVIETIDLGVESDPEDVKEPRDDDAEFKISASVSSDDNVLLSDMAQQDYIIKKSVNLDPNIKVKTEPVEDGLSNVKILEATHVNQEVFEDENDINDVDSVQEEENLISKVIESMEPSDEIIEEKKLPLNDMDVLATESNIHVSDSDAIINEKAKFRMNERKEIPTIDKSQTQYENDTKHISEDDEDIVDDIIKQKADDFIYKSDDIVDDIIKLKADNFVRKSNDIIKQKSDEFIRKSNDVDDMKQKSGKLICKSEENKVDIDVVHSYNLVTDNMSFVDGGIDFVDDGIEYIEDDEISNSVNKEPEKLAKSFSDTTEEDTDDSIEGTPKFDLKLLMEPVVYTAKLDEMIIAKDKDFRSINDKDLIDGIIIESKPISNRFVNVKAVKQENKVQTELQENNSQKDDGGSLKNDFSDYDSDKDITADQKIKISSSLLQKPRSRNYNPIQLCKNPDFNTRLKRLTAGFFSYPRNRQLLKACMPMTIDLHKAFETKLVDGTLYLKSGGDAAVPLVNENKNHNEQTASVVPSAMPIQSLIDNINIVDDLVTPIDNSVVTPAHSRITAKTSASHIDLTKSEEIAERNKTINLPDIKEVRRINQRLQTAEVSPIRVHNTCDTTKLSNESVSLASHDQSSDRISSELLNVKESTSVVLQTEMTGIVPKKTGNVDDTFACSQISNTTKLTNESVPSASQDHSSDRISSGLLDDKGLLPFDVKGIPPKKTDNVNDTFDCSQTNDKLVLQPDKLPTVDKNLLRSDVSTSDTLLNDKVNETDGKSLNKVKRTLQRRNIPVAWNKPIDTMRTARLDEFLITIDTLNKMLNKINGDELYVNPNHKNKKHNWVIKENKKNQEVEKTSKKQKCNTSKIQQTPSTSKLEAPLSSQNQVPIAEPVINAAKVPKIKTKIVAFRGRECCWARAMLEKALSKRLRVPKHTCPILDCSCCCRDALQNKINETCCEPQKPIELSDDEENTDLQHVSKTIETVIQQVNQTPSPTIRILTGDDVLKDPSPAPAPVPPLYVMPHKPKQVSGRGIRVIAAAALQPDAQSDVTGSCSRESDSANCLDQGLPQSITVNSANSNTTTEIAIDLTSMKSVMSTSTQTTTLQTKSPNKPAAQVMEIPLLRNIAISSSNEKIRPACAVPNTASKKSVQVNQRKIVIDGSKGSPISRTLVQDPTPIHNNAFFLNMSRKPAESPICLGKNKILLTTVKFPAEFGRKPSQIQSNQHPKVIPTLPLPTGVQLMLLPNGELTYTLEPGVELSAADLAILPSILSVVKEQINSNPPQLVNIEPSVSRRENITHAVTQEEVIKLLDDDSSTPLDTSNTNQETVIHSSQEHRKSINSTVQENTDLSTPHIGTCNVDNLKEVNKTPDVVVEVSKPDPNMGHTAISYMEVDEQQQQQQNIKLLNSKVQVNTELNSNNITEKDDKISEVQTSNLNDEKVTLSKTGIDAEKPCTNASDSVSTGTSRNLLSDLMAMSGISAEDTKVVSQESTLPVVSADQGTVLNIDEDLQNRIVSNDAGLQCLIMTSNAMTSPSDVVSLPELTAITSIAELKYACKQNGQFFKLDFETGIIVPINVCIKKNDNKRKAKHNNASGVATVDLTVTDDIDDSITPLNMLKPRKQYQIRLTRPQKQEECLDRPQINKTDVVKPIKLFRSIHKKQPVILKQVLKTKNKVSNDSGAPITAKRRRKQFFNKIEAKIDLVDSDAPMEEEYLLESSDSDEEISRRTHEQLKSCVAEGDDDSSDEEPLASKIKRMRGNDDSVKEKCEADNAAEKMLANVTSKRPDAIGIEATEDNAESTTDTAAEPQKHTMEAKDLEDAENTEIEEQPTLFFHEEDDAQEDCILGF